MPKIIIQTYIGANKKVVFDLARSIDLHEISTQKTKEEAIAGVTSGLIEMGESVTWRAKHFGVYQNLTSKITMFEYPDTFTDEMMAGIFKRFKHEHLFDSVEDGTLMTDIFSYKSPLGILGRIADKLFLEKYMEKLLRERNKVIKEFAECEYYNFMVADLLSRTN